MKLTWEKFERWISRHLSWDPEYRKRLRVLLETHQELANAVYALIQVDGEDADRYLLEQLCVICSGWGKPHRATLRPREKLESYERRVAALQNPNGTCKSCDGSGLRGRDR